MIYVVTVHWKDDRWIRLQRQFLDRYLQKPFRVFGWLTGISKELDAYFDFVRDQDDPSHSDKLNILTQDILNTSNDDADVIIFLDGDAFPIAPLSEKLENYLQNNPLVAVQRRENSGDLQPHPCFCATTTGFWRKYHPTWSEGFIWENALGLPTTDVGAGLLEVLSQNHIVWKALLRSNALNLHPLLFGVYDDLVYHHGAGFREGELVRRDYDQFIRPVRRGKAGRFLMQLIPQKYRQGLRNSVLHPVGRTRNRLVSQNTALSQKVFQSLLTNPDRFIANLLSQSESS